MTPGPRELTMTRHPAYVPTRNPACVMYVGRLPPKADTPEET
jgi:hypothetical protein